MKKVSSPKIGPSIVKSLSAVAPLTAVKEGLIVRTWASLVIVVVLVVGLGGWSATAKLSGAIIGSGQVVVESSIKKVQHPTGGIVGEIQVKNGDLVEAGQIVMRLDSTQTRAALGMIVAQLTELRGSRARLISERDDSPEIDFPAGFEELGGDAVRIAIGERKLMDSRRRSIAGQKEQLRARIKQHMIEVDGFGLQLRTKHSERDLVREELARVVDMHVRNLTPVTRVISMQRDEMRIDGEHGVITSHIGRIGGQIAELELQILNLDQSVRTDAQKTVRELDAKIAEFEERRIAAEDQLRRIDIRAPQAGAVHELAVHTVGGVIGPAETVMQIVPRDETLAIDVRLAPQDIDQALLGQKVMLRFVAFNQRTTPELPGTIVRVGADLSRETQSGATFYVARIAIDDVSLTQLGSFKLIPGMPVEAHIETGERTALSYLMKPLTDHFRRAFRED